MKKSYKYLFILSCLFLSMTLLNGCSSFNKGFQAEQKSTSNQILELTVDKGKTNKENLRESVVLLNSTPIHYGEYDATIVGATFNKSMGDAVKDVGFVGNGLIKESTEDSTSRGYKLGFYNSSDAEISKKNAYLSIYLKLQLTNKKATQRDSVIPKLTISGKDDKKDGLNLIYYSNWIGYNKLDRFFKGM